METDNSKFTVLQIGEAIPTIQQIISRENIHIILYDANITQEQRNLVHGIFIYSYSIPYYDGKILDSFPNLKVLSSCSVGLEHIDIAASTERGIKVGHAPNASTDCTADMGFALLLASARNVVEGNLKCRQPTTSKVIQFDWFGENVSGSTLGIVGMGNIGSEVANRARGFKMRILYHNRNRKNPDQEKGAEYCPNLDELLRQSDFVMITIRSTPQTIGMFTSRQFSLMKPTSTLINIARGNIVNQDDLVEALQNGTIRAAALDVTDPEPLLLDHPLLKLPNVIITPHIGASTLRSRNVSVNTTVENLMAGLKGEKLPYGAN